MGEVGGARPEGFDFGNSPFELSSADVEGKTLVQSTRAGTVGATAAVNADEIYVASLVTAESTATAVSRRAPDLVTIVAMGADAAARTDEDEQCALYIRNLLQGRKPDPKAVRELVMAGAESRKFDDPDYPHHHPMDREIALQIDSIPFAVRVTRGRRASGSQAGGSVGTRLQLGVGETGPEASGGRPRSRGGRRLVERADGRRGVRT